MNGEEYNENTVFKHYFCGYLTGIRIRKENQFLQSDANIKNDHNEHNEYIRNTELELNKLSKERMEFW